jgi:hypothetical protein
MIHEQRLLIDKMHKKIDEQSELIKNIQQKISLSSSSSSHEGHVSSNKGGS